MREVRLNKVTVNIGIGDNEDRFQNAKALLEKLTGRIAVATKSKHRVPELKVRKGQVIGAMVTLRNKEASELLKRALDANNNTVYESSVANNSINFGVSEYIYFSGVKYDPKIGMLGLNVNGSFGRRGKRVETRKRGARKVSSSHRDVSKEEIMEFMKERYGAKFVKRER